MENPEENFNYQRIEQAIRYIEDNFIKQPNLDEVASALNLSPFHFQRLFTQWAGISPKKFLQYLTADFLKSRLNESKNLVEAADKAGLSSQSRVYDLFVHIEAMTPQEYKTKGEGIQIDYGFHPTPFGECLIGVTSRGICKLDFINETFDRDHAMHSLTSHWENARFTPNDDITGQTIEHIFAQSKGPDKTPVRLLLKGTNFQIKVWEALLKIPHSHLVTYQTVAEKIGNPKAMQAVGSAVGANPVAYLIPCHRVIRKEGILGEYHWGSARKKILVGWEMSHPQSDMLT